MEFSFTWRAPVGQQFRIDAPATGFDVVQVEVHLDGGSSYASSGAFYHQAPMVTVMGGNARRPDYSQISLTGPTSGDPSRNSFQLYSRFSITPGESFSFESMTMSITIPASFDTAFPNVSAMPRLYGRALSFDDTSSDPGQWIRLETIPEPSIASLALLAGALGLLHRRR